METVKSKNIYFLFALIAVLAVTGITAFFITAQNKAYRIIQVFELNGSATVEREGKGNFNVYNNMNLQSGDTLKVSGGYLRLKLDDDKFIMLEEGTVINLEASGNNQDSRTKINLTQGAVVSELKNKLNGNSEYQVTTPVSTMSVRGTIFRVGIDNGNTFVQTFEGSVSVSLDGNSNNDAENFVNKGKCALIGKTSDTAEFIYYDQDIKIEDLPVNVVNILLESANSSENDLCFTKDEMSNYILHNDINKSIEDDILKENNENNLPVQPQNQNNDSNSDISSDGESNSLHSSELRNTDNTANIVSNKKALPVNNANKNIIDGRNDNNIKVVSNAEKPFSEKYDDGIHDSVIQNNENDDLNIPHNENENEKLEDSFEKLQNIPNDMPILDNPLENKDNTVNEKENKEDNKEESDKTINIKGSGSNGSNAAKSSNSDKDKDSNNSNSGGGGGGNSNGSNSGSDSTTTSTSTETTTEYTTEETTNNGSSSGSNGENTTASEATTEESEEATTNSEATTEETTNDEVTTEESTESTTDDEVTTEESTESTTDDEVTTEESTESTTDDEVTTEGSTETTTEDDEVTTEVTTEESTETTTDDEVTTGGSTETTTDDEVTTEESTETTTDDEVTTGESTETTTDDEVTTGESTEETTDSEVTTEEITEATTNSEVTTEESTETTTEDDEEIYHKVDFVFYVQNGSSSNINPIAHFTEYVKDGTDLSSLEPDDFGFYDELVSILKSKGLYKNVAFSEWLLPQDVVTFDMLVSGIYESTVNISFDLNGGEGDAPDNIKAFNYDEIELPLTDIDFHREHYEFLGWSLNKNSTEAVYDAYNPKYTVQGYGKTEIVFYAVWKKVE